MFSSFVFPRRFAVPMKSMSSIRLPPEEVGSFQGPVLEGVFVLNVQSLRVQAVVAVFCCLCNLFGS